MGWSDAFKAALSARTLAPLYLLEVVSVWEEPGAPYLITSDPRLGGDPLIERGGIQVQGQTVSPRGWSSVIGGFTVRLVGDPSRALQHLTRGTIVELRMGFSGWDPDDFEPIALGQVRNLRGTPPVWSLEVLDLLSALRQRLDTTRGVHMLFSDATSVAELTANYTPGDTSLEVSTTSLFQRETGADGAVLVTPTTGAPFYLTWSGTGTGPTRFTGVSTSGVCGTPAVAAVIGDAVQEVVLLAGHPLDIARKIMCSRGGGNGAYDVFPATWGLGLLDELVDHDDVDQWRDEVVRVASGDYVWQYPQTATVEDAYSWLAGLLAGAGLCLVMRQGRLTIRAAQDTQAPRLHSGITITDADIIGIEEYEAWEQGHSPEYCYVTVASADAAEGTLDAGTEAATLPQAVGASYNLSDRVFDNQSAQTGEVLARVRESALGVPERLVLRCVGLRLAELTALDIVTLTSSRAWSRRDGTAGFDGRDVEVDEMTPDYVGGTVRIGLLIYPQSEDTFE